MLLVSWEDGGSSTYTTSSEAQFNTEDLDILTQVFL